MNLILLSTADFISANRIRIDDHRLRHIQKILRSQIGDQLRVGLINSACGTGTLVKLAADELEMTISLDRPPPAALALRLVVALPRPPSLRKIIQQGTAMGIKKFVFIHSTRVEKSYWSSSVLQEGALQKDMLLGLEQAGDTVMPQIEFHRRFATFMAERWLGLVQGSTPILADPSLEPLPSFRRGEPITLIVGPEGGFVPHEIATFHQQGCIGLSLGERTLRVETAVVALTAQLTSKLFT